MRQECPARTAVPEAEATAVDTGKCRARGVDGGLRLAHHSGTHSRDCSTRHTRCGGPRRVQLASVAPQCVVAGLSCFVRRGMTCRTATTTAPTTRPMRADASVLTTQARKPPMPATPDTLSSRWWTRSYGACQ